MSNPRPHPQPSCQPLLSPSSSSSSYSPLPPYTQISSFSPMTSWQDMQQLPQSWSQLLLGGLEEEEDRCSFSAMQTKRMENWNDHQVLYQPGGGAPKGDLKQETSGGGYVYGGSNQEIQGSWPSWSQTLPTSSPSSCVTSLTSSMLDFSSSRSEGRNHQLDHPSEVRETCNNTSVGSAFKKARVQASSAQSTFKVRKEKLGDRITSLHQIVSPFGKTDTASVLLEAIGYIRFLQSQIEALSSPYMGSRSGSVRQPVQGEMNCIFPEDPGQLLNDTKLRRRGPLDQDGEEGLKKDLRSRGLCLVPMSFTLHVGSDNGADYWAPSMGGAFR